MRRGRIFILIALILILGLVGVAFTWFRFIQPMNAPAASSEQSEPVSDLVDVVVTNKPVTRGTVLDKSVLTTIQIQKDLLVDEYFTNVAQAIGRQVRVDLDANMLITSSMLIDSAEQVSKSGSLAALAIPRGMVAVSIRMDQLSSVSYALQPGDHVNVIVTLEVVDLDPDFQTITPNQTAAVLGSGPGVLIGTSTEDGNSSTLLNNDVVKITAQVGTGGLASPGGRTEVDTLLDQSFYMVPSERQRPRLVSQMLLQDAVVLGVGDFSESDSEPETEQAPVETPPPAEGDTSGQPAEQQAPVEPKRPDTITLIVTPQDAVTLNYLVFGGAQLTLALRASGDDSVVETQSATLDFLLNQYKIAVPAKLPYGTEPRVDQVPSPVSPSETSSNGNQ
jgi:pilus assembly protein CpaB